VCGLAELARRQCGVVSAQQLRVGGLGPNAIERRVRHGWLRRLHRGVYAVGHGPLSFTGRCWAASLATDGVLSHRTAAALWDLMPAPAGTLDVTTPHGATRPGIRVHPTRLALVGRQGLPRPRVNARVAGFEVDFLWPAQRLVAETDGAAAHLTPTAFERDRRCDAALAVAGYGVLRFTWRQVVDEPSAVAAALRARLREG